MYTYTLHDIYFFIPIIVWCLAQIIKAIIDSFSWKKITFRSFISSWGIPSAHSTLTSSILVMVILIEWLFTTMTMVVSVFTFLIWYDATNVRYESWKHAQYINSLRDEMQKVMLQDHVSDILQFKWLW
jgi:acid phosphatase family membrane protein YuiD